MKNGTIEDYMKKLIGHKVQMTYKVFDDELKTATGVLDEITDNVIVIRTGSIYGGFLINYLNRKSSQIVSIMDEGEYDE